MVARNALVLIGGEIAEMPFGDTLNGGGGGGGATIHQVEVDFLTASPGKIFDVALGAAVAGQKVLASPSLIMPAGVQQDEFEADPFAVAGSVPVNGTIRLAVTSLAGPIKGKRNINVILV